MQRGNAQDPQEYLARLGARARESRVYRNFQLTGLEIADILGDRDHASLYIKLAKEGDVRELLRIAKTVAETKGVRNRGAYFMKIISQEKKIQKLTSNIASRKVTEKKKHGKRNLDS